MHDRFFPTEDDAQAWIKELRDQWMGPGQAQPQTVAHLLDTWLGEMETGGKRGSGQLRGERTLIEYKKKVATYLIPAFGSLRLGELSPGHIRDWRQDLLAGTGVRRPLSPRTINAAHSLLGAALQMAVEQREVAWNPARAVRRLGVASQTVGMALPLQAWQEALELALARLDDGGMLVLLAGAMGLRRGEALAVEWTSVRLMAPQPWLECGRSLQQVTGKGLVITDGKNRWSRRSIAIPEFVADALKAAYRPRTRFVCGDRVRDPARQEKLAWYPIRDRIMWPSARLHDLRHTLITHLELQPDLNEVAIKSFVGHAPSGVTQSVYTHHAPGLLPNTVVVAARIDKMYREQERSAFRVIFKPTLLS